MFLIIFLNLSLENSQWLNLLRGAKEIDSKQIEYFLNETKKLAKILGSSILALKGKNKF